MAAFSTIYADIFAGLRQKNAADNERLSLTDVKAAANDAYRWIAERVALFTRSFTIAAVDDQAGYTLPADICAVTDVYWNTSTTSLEFISKRDLARTVATTWRSASGGTPRYWYKDGDRGIGFYPPPAVATTEVFTLYGVCVPWSPGDSISALARLTNVVTCSTTNAHGLIVGDQVTISGCGTATFNAAYTVATVPSTTQFTATQAGANATVSSTFGYVKYTGGKLPLIADTDVPDFFVGAHDIITQRAMVRIAAMRLITDPHAQAMAPIADKLSQDYLRDLMVSTSR
jgi:hypothetical protein